MRLDQLVAEKFAISRTKAAHFIEEGRVFCDGKLADKPSKDVPEDARLSLDDEGAFASAGGDKLEKALNNFGADVSGAICADIGASNGGFTDCLLRRGAAKVFAVDVGECALPDRLKTDPRVVVKDRLNARYIMPSDLGGEPLDVVTIDVSFISLKLILPPAERLLKHGGRVFALIKPQFEAGKSALSKRGIVTSPKVRQAVVDDICAFAKDIGFEVVGVTSAPIKKDKNVEFVALFLKN